MLLLPIIDNKHSDRKFVEIVQNEHSRWRLVYVEAGTDLENSVHYVYGEAQSRHLSSSICTQNNIILGMQIHFCQL